VAPFKVAVFPLFKKEGMPEVARNVYDDLRKHVAAVYDDGGSIGKRYRRQDEIGTPFCLTIDHESLEDNSVTLRDRDSLEQTRVPISEIVSTIIQKVNA
jgi:glycyl-tRNA synthetase